MLDLDNKNVAKIMEVPPALLEEIMSGNEDALSGLARAQLTYLMERMTLRCADPSTSPAAVASIMEILRKMATSNKADANNSGPQVVINISRAKNTDDHLIIEGNKLETFEDEE